MKKIRITAFILSLCLFVTICSCSKAADNNTSDPVATDSETESPTSTPFIETKLDIPYGDDGPEINLYEVPFLSLGSLYIHDPVMIRENDKWYAFGTGYSITRYSSADGQRFTEDGFVFFENPSWHRDFLKPDDDSLWAPDIIKWNNYYYLYYSVSTFGSNTSVIGLARNKTLDDTSEEYNWEDLGPVISSDSSCNYNCIDPNVIVDENGWPYLSFGSFWSGLKLIRLNPETMLVDDGAELISIAQRDGTGAIEAPFIIYRDGYYYLFASIDFCCRGLDSTYKVICGRSESIEGPYLDKDGKSLLEGGGTLLIDASDKYAGPGHCFVYQSGDTAVIGYHAYSKALNGQAQFRINSLYFDDEGWPYTETGLAQ